jgi:hypothetical protein
MRARPSTVGPLRLAKSCKAHERAVSWSHAGPAGPTGPSDVYARQINGGSAPVTIPIATSGQTRIMTLSLPAGSYLVTLTINANVGLETNASLYCGDVGSGNNVDDYVDSNSVYQSASVQDMRVLSRPTTLKVNCGTFNGNSGGTAGIWEAQLTAVKTGTIHR